MSTVDRLGAPPEGRSGPPHVIVFAGRPDALTPQVSLAVTSSEVPGWWVLTPERLAWVIAVPTTTGAPANGSGRSVLAQVRGFARESLAVFADRDAYPPSLPVPTIPMVTGAEVPRGRITGITVAKRKLPRDFGSHQTDALRISLVDGSGVDFVGGLEPVHAQRMLEMVNGQR